MQVTKEGIERIKGANELSAVLAERGVELKKKGRVLVACCPFHDEKTASFTVTPGKGLFHCFGCGAAGDVIGFVTKHDKLTFGRALEALARRAGLDLGRLMEERPRGVVRTPVEALTPPASLKGKDSNGNGHGGASSHEGLSAPTTGAVLARVVEHYHRTFCQRQDAQEYLARRGLTDLDLLRALKVGYADGSLLELVPKGSELRRQLALLGVITAEGRELLGGCVVVPIPDPATGQWSTLYGRGLKVERHCYLPGPLRGVLNFQAARMSREVVLAESVLDALSFHQAGVATAIPLYGTNGFTADHLDTLKREGVLEAILALDNDDAGRKATEALKERLQAAGLSVRVARYPEGIKDANELLVSRNGDAGETFRRMLEEAEPRPASVVAAVSPLSEEPRPSSSAAPRSADQVVLERDGVRYQARVLPVLLGRLRATIKAERGTSFHVDTLDLYASRSRSEYAKRAAKALTVDAAAVESALLALLVEAEKATAEEAGELEASGTHDDRSRARRGSGAAEAAGSPRPGGPRRRRARLRGRGDQQAPAVPGGGVEQARRPALGHRAEPVRGPARAASPR